MVDLLIAMLPCYGHGISFFDLPDMTGLTATGQLACDVEVDILCSCSLFCESKADIKQVRSGTWAAVAAKRLNRPAPHVMQSKN